MFGNTKSQRTPSTTTPSENSASTPAAKRPGTTFDLCQQVAQPDGTTKWKNVGTIFLRASGNGGVAFVKDDGQTHELAIFVRKHTSKAA